MRRIPDTIYSHPFSYAMEDDDPVRQAEVLAFLGIPQLRISAPPGRPSFTRQLWSARAVAATLVTFYYRRDRCSLAEAARQTLAWWPRRGLSAPSPATLLRYRRHYFMATGINADSVAAEFLQHSNDEQGHADQIAQRIVQLGGEPNLSPEGLLTRSHAEYVEGETLTDMIKEDLVAERIAIDSYRDIIQYLGNDDPTSRRLMETILAVEEEHADDLVSLLGEFGK